KVALRAAENQRLAAEVERTREAYIDEKARDLLAYRKGMTIKEARAAVEKRIGGILTPDLILPLDEDARVTVGQVLDNRTPFVGLTLADPIDGEEQGKAKIMMGSDGLPFIHSFAHGGGVYRLRYDARAIRERIENATDKPDALARFMIAADIDAV